MPKRSRSQVEALQEQAKHLFNQGLSQSDVAKILGCSTRTLQRWNKEVTPSSEPIAMKSVATAIDSPNESEPATTPSRILKHVQNMKDEAIEKLEQGMQLHDIALELGMPLGTVIRWASGASEQSQDLISAYLPEIQAYSLSGKHLPDSPFWVEEKERVADESQKFHQAIERKMFSTLNDYLDEPEKNIRVIDKLSQALTRHTNAVLGSLDHKYTDGNKALQLLIAHGYSVVNMQEIAEGKRKQKEKFSSTPSPK